MLNDYKVDGDVVTIFIKSPKHGLHETTINTVDLERAKQARSWMVKYVESSNSYYVRGFTENGGMDRHVYLHRYILGITEREQVIDHVDHNPLNNQRENLNVVNHKKNGQNRVISNNNTSGVNGVSYHKGQKKWFAYIRVNDKLKHLGTFDDLSEAKKARRNSELKHFSYLSRIKKEMEI